MMHEAAARFIRQAAQRAGLPRNAVAEFGSRYVNGTARDLVPARTWWGIDLTPGPAVDQVADAATWDPPEGVWIDTVICAEVFEHTPSGPEICGNAHRVLAPGGWLIVTCAAPPRAPHAADGSGPPRRGEYYRNVTMDDLSNWVMGAGFVRGFVVDGRPNGFDVYAAVQKGTG